ncbi:MAG TPA: FixH family protein [Anaeromyxobacteraceae bacterium]|nr:FixH family protein [Anaeromyxobacteraceae bacterium]
MRALLLATSLAALSLAACGDSAAPPPTSKVSLGSATAGGYTVELFADEALGTGLNAVHARVTSGGTGAAVTDAAVAIVPMMDMGTMQHSCPVSGPMAWDASVALYGANLVFQMAGTWTATVTVTRPATPPVDVAFPSLPVVDTGCAKTFTVAMAKYVLSMNYVTPPVVGLNPILVTLHSTTDMGMTFAPVDDASFALDPQMPSMGHGSPGSVAPTLVADGVYQGQLSFNMRGDWETTVAVTRGGVTLAAPKFLTTF